MASLASSTLPDPSEGAAVAQQRGLRILIVAPSGIGGTIQYAHNLCDALAAQGHDVALATAIGTELAAFPRRYALIEVFDRFTPRWGAIRRFVARVRDLQPDIVHFQGAQRPEFYGLVWLVLRRMTDARFVWTPQDVLSNSARPHHLRLLRFLYARMDHVFLNARQNVAPVRDLFGVPEARISVLPIPDLVAFARRDLGRALPPEITLDRDAPLLLCFGLIEERKGIGTLIDAFAQVESQGAGATLLIMGKALTDTGPFETALARHGLGPARAQIIARYASFEEMNGLFEAAHGVILPYHSGWNSGVLSAALGHGRPVVATTVGGFDEVVADGRTGLLVPPRDSPALAAAILRLIREPGLRDHLAQGAAEAGSAASWDAVAQTTVDVLRGLVSQGKPDVVDVPARKIGT